MASRQARPGLQGPYPTRFGANVAQVANLTDLQIMALMQSGFASGAKSGTCNHCKKPGHWKRECPELKNQQAIYGIFCV
jgi:hypothetical protein